MTTDEMAVYIGDRFRAIKMRIKQHFCNHDTRRTTEWMEGKIMVSQTVCIDCGKRVPEHESFLSQVDKMMRYQSYAHEELKAEEDKANG